MRGGTGPYSMMTDTTENISFPQSLAVIGNDGKCFAQTISSRKCFADMK